MNFIKEQFILTNKYIKENILRLFVILLIGFLVFGIVFYFVMLSMPQYAEDVFNQITELMDMENIMSDDGSISAIGLFFNNIRASVFTYIYGFVPFFFLPVCSIILNSSIVGLTLGIVEVVSTESIFITIIKYLLPHGIFEIPAFILSAASGTRLCLVICGKIFGKAKAKKIIYHLKNYLRLLVFYIVPLLIIAAFIEGVVLPMLFL